MLRHNFWSIFFSFFSFFFSPFNFLLSAGACRMRVTCIARCLSVCLEQTKKKNNAQMNFGLIKESIAFTQKLIFALIYARGTLAHRHTNSHTHTRIQNCFISIGSAPRFFLHHFHFGARERASLIMLYMNMPTLHIRTQCSMLWIWCNKMRVWRKIAVPVDVDVSSLFFFSFFRASFVSIDCFALNR